MKYETNLGLFKNSIYSQNMIKNFIEQNQRNVEFFFVKHLHNVYTKQRIRTSNTNSLCAEHKYNDKIFTNFC